MNNKESFDALYKDHYNKVFRVCLGYVKGNNSIASDLTQDVFIKVWTHLDSFKSASKISTWIFKITVNTCLLYLRNSKKVLMDDPIGAQEEDKVELEKRIQKMYNCIDKLKPRNKTIILLELESVPQKEIADIMGISHEAIRVRILRIKNSLSKCVK